MKEYDVVIVGAGPAGSALAMKLDPTLRVLMLHDAIHEKPCGGLLAPDAQRELAKLSLTLPKNVLVDPQVFSVQVMDLISGESRTYQRMYLNVDRRKFDDWMRSLAPQNVSIINGRATKIIHEKRILEYCVGLEEGCEKEKINISYKYLVGADGANSFVRNQMKMKLKTRQYTAIQQWFPQINELPGYTCLFDAEATDCCSWTIHKDGKTIFGGAYPMKQCRKQFEMDKNQLICNNIPLPEPERTESCLVTRPIGPRSFCNGAHDVFLVGEAAGYISPSSLEGISSAIITGLALADSMNQKLKGKEVKYDSTLYREMLMLYQLKTRKQRRKLILKNLKCPFMYQQTLRNLVLKSGFTALREMDTKL